MNNADKCRKGNCSYDMPATDEEIEAMAWLLKTLHSICDRKRPNADKADAVIRLLHKTGDHMRMIVDRIHECEDVLHGLGMREVDVSEIDRLAPGELN